MAQTKKKKRNYKSHKAVFHTPEKKGQVINIPWTKPLIILTVVSLLLQVILTATAIICTVNRYDPSAPLGKIAGINITLFYLALPIILWILTGALFAGLKFMPLEMWRMPVAVREGMYKCQGTLLKMITLLIEIATAICFLYVTLTIYFGKEPSNTVMLIWVAALVVSVVLPCQDAKQLANERIINK
ncbi:MAG: hypothetical protein KBS83_05905 [Lachnospiraceae bacterium]|nr:hypothetical protein [Candidatus Equihabitans merdae]